MIMSEDALFILEEGTEVSAKFKGAFCEAKIKKVDRIIKCKVTLKSSNESVTVSESQLVNMSGQALSTSELKTGTTVYLGKSDQSPSKLQQALLNRIIDQSVYTVVFNDGDEKCLKRSFIRFKGEKHFLDSETLNNAPLNNPEHFLYPIKSQSKQSPNSSFNEGKNESDIESCSNFSPKKERDNEVDEDELSITSSSDDYSPEDKDMFVAQLYKFMDDRGTPMNKLPTINKKDIDLHKLFIVVKKFGGFNKVNKQRNWTDVYKRLAMSVPSAANIANLKSSYKRYLQPYEDLHRKLGDSLLVSSQGSKRSSESKRLFNARYLAPIQKKTQTRTSRKTVDTEPSNNNNTETADEAQSVIQDNDSIQDDLSQQTEELTLSGMVKNLNENFRKAKKEKEKETKSKCNSKSKPKIRRTSVDKASRKSHRSCDEHEDFEDQEEEEEEDEPKRRKRNKKTDEASEESGSTISIRVSKRKSSTGKIDDTECDKTTESDETDNKMFALSQIELNKVVEVRYGSGKNTYHAKIVKIDSENETLLVHYLGWNNRYDEWIHLRQIIKIFSDDYGAFKRRKLIKQDSTDSSSKIKIEAKNSKITKRASLSSISSSSSADAKKDAELNTEKKPAKSRSSESGSSLVSSECNAGGEKNSDCADKKMVTTESKAEALLSIKEEVVDYELQVLEHSDNVSFIQTITNELVDKCIGLVEYMPRSVCAKEELMPVFSSEMVVCESSQFKEKLQVEMVESGEKKSALNETNLNNVNQSVAVCEIKVHKEKENSKHDVSKFPFHLTGCSLVGKHKIKFIEEQMRLCREEYAKLKNELATIDRKRKKLKRNMLEKSASSLNVDDNVRHELKK